MTEVSHRVGTRPSLLWRLWIAIRAREETAESERDESVSFAELVWAHHERQRELYAGFVDDSEWEKRYRTRLKRFKAQYGEIVEAYWCRFEASGVAVTEFDRPRRFRNFYRRDMVLRLHTATDWRTSEAPTIAFWLHRWRTTSIKVSEVLRDTSERIALNWIFASSCRLLAAADRDPAQGVSAACLQEVVADQQEELDALVDYYERAGENSARIVYFRGMAWGAIVLAAIVGGGFLGAWGAGWLDPHDKSTYTVFVTMAMGAAGAILSVITRMAKRDGFNLEFEVGRKSIRYLGGLRPWIGALFALALYLALKSSLLEFVQSGTPHGIYFYATIGFVAGFSERRAKVLLDSVGGSAPEDERSLATRTR
jgi:hypothetical protein